MRGHIRERKGPTGTAYELRIYGGTDPRTGKERRITRTFRGTKRDAERQLTKLLGEYDAGHHTGPDATLTTLLNRYLEVGAGDWSASTLREQTRIVKRHLIPELGALPLSALVRRPEEIDVAYAKLRKIGGRDGKALSEATVRRIHVVLHAALGQAVRWNWIVSNPADRIRKPVADDVDLQPPEPADVVRALKVIREKDPMIFCIVVLAAVTGARRGELLALRWSHVDLDDGTIDVRRALAIGTGGIVDQPRTKTRRQRKFSIDAGTVAILKAWRKKCVEAALACGVSLTDDAYLFATEPDGIEPWRPDSLSRRWGRIRTKHKLARITLKDLRHFVATQLLDHRVPVKTVQDRLGHDRATTTLDTYASSVPESDREAARLLEQIIGL